MSWLTVILLLSAFGAGAACGALVARKHLPRTRKVTRKVRPKNWTELAPGQWWHLDGATRPVEVVSVCAKQVEYYTDGYRRVSYTEAFLKVAYRMEVVEEPIEPPQRDPLDTVLAEQDEMLRSLKSISQRVT